MYSACGARMRNRALLLAYRWMRASGFDPRMSGWFVRGVPRYFADYFAIRRKLGADWPIRPSCPDLADRHQSAGSASGHYFHQDLLVAQRIFQRSPGAHADVGSRIDGFVAHVAAFRPIEIMDIRPLHAKVRNITFRQCDLMAPPRDVAGKYDSVSCLHALEHFGLGRYGDPLMADGWQRGMRGLASLVKPGGLLYLSVPVGYQRIEFNGHRVFSPRTILDEAAVHGLTLESFAYVDDGGDLHLADPMEPGLAAATTLRYGCGIFEFRRSQRVIRGTTAE